ncbi:hypothetical protein FHS49_000292 [Sphingobium boeckii]|uniref:Uncharacterized protein n=2 Tax=Sphingobium boeckii TaxID=1082345 RepID=A0A7W9AF63_9SPHN|nr:hypothetical protein [Sphingobium boeckii]
MIDINNGWCYARGNSDHFTLHRVIDGVLSTTGLGPWIYQAVPQAWNLYSVIEARVETNGALGLYLDDELVPASVISGSSVNTFQPDRGTGVSFAKASGGAASNIIYGVGGVDLRIPDVRYDIANNWFEIDILYSDTPSGYKYTLNNGSENDAVLLTNTVAGEATLRTLPIGGSVGAITVKAILNDNPTINKTAIITVPAPAQFGMNLAGLSSYGYERAYTNLLLASGWQDGTLLDNPEALPGSAHINLDGEPISSPNGTHNPSGHLVAGITRPDTPGSVVRVEWDGEAVTSLLADGVTVTGETSGANFRQFTYGHDWTGPKRVMFHVHSTNPANHMRNIVACELDRDPTVDLFTPEFIARQNEFNGPMRLMDFLNTNNLQTFEGDWDERTPNGRLNVFRPYGMAIENVITLINAVGKDAWVNTPPFASDDYVRGFFTALNNGVNPGITLYAEVGNEWGNAAFGLYHRARQKAYDNGRATLEEFTDGGGAMATRNEQAFQHQRQMTILDSLGAPTGRFVRVITAMGTSNELNLVTQRGATRTDAICNAPYFGGSMTPSMFDGSLETIFATARSMMNTTWNNYASTNAAYKAAGLRAICYEWQQHVVFPENGYTPDQEAKLRAFQTDDRMRELIRDGLLRWASDFGDVLCFFNSIGEPHPYYGSWGAKKNQNATLEESPKWAGFLEAQAAI